jgi:small subunit ribosomal protein S8
VAGLEDISGTLAYADCALESWLIKENSLELLNQVGNMTDPIADLLSRIKNAYMARHGELQVPFSKMKESICNVLVQEGYVSSVKVADVDSRKSLLIKLKYQKNEAAISNIKQISKPGVRIYSKYAHIPRVWGGLGISILSTPRGIMSDKEAKKQKLGGELICQIW